MNPYDKQRQEANRSLLQLVVMIGAVALGWKIGREHTYNPWLMTAGLGVPLLWAYYFRRAHEAGKEFTSGTYLLSSAVLGFGFGLAGGNFFGIF